MDEPDGETGLAADAAGKRAEREHFAVAVSDERPAAGWAGEHGVGRVRHDHEYLPKPFQEVGQPHGDPAKPPRKSSSALAHWWYCATPQRGSPEGN